MKPSIEFEEDANLPRKNYRVKPTIADPIRLLVAGREVEIIDLSVKGVAFRYFGEADKANYPIEIIVKARKPYSICCSLSVIRYQDNVFSGVFDELSTRDQAMLNKLIMALQRRDIRESARKKTR